MNSLLQNIVGCLAVGLAVSFASAQDAASVPQKPGENPKADATSSAGNGTRPAIDATDEKSDASVPGEEPAKSTAPARQDTKPVADDGDEVKIFHLHRADATAARNLVLELYPAQFKDRSKIAADSRTNALVARGPHDLLDVIEAVLLALDERETAKQPKEKRARDPQSKSETSGDPAPSREARARDNWVADLQTAADPDADVTRMKEEFRRQEQQAGDLARRYRQAEGAAAPDDVDLQKIKQSLEGAVQAAFDARQKVQRFEAEQLRLRLTRIEDRLTNRERVEKEIIRQRVEQLLHPDREWEPADDAPVETDAAPTDAASASHKAADAVGPLRRTYSTGGPAQTGEPESPGPDSVWMTDFKHASERAQKLGRPFLVHFTARSSALCRRMERDVLRAPAVEQLLGLKFVAVRVDVEKAAHLQTEYEIKALPTDLILGPNGNVLLRSVGAKTADAYVKMLRTVDGLATDNFSPEPGDPGAARSDRPGTSSNPRKEVLDAEFAVSAARAKVDAEEKNCKSAQKEFEFIRKVSRTGALPEKRMREAEKNVESSAQRLEKAKLDLEHAEAQVKLARENLDAQRKLLELDMENAKLRMAHLADRETRARRLIENKALSQSEYDETRLALEQAKLEVSRIQEQIDLYSRPIPGGQRAVPAEVKPGEPDSEARKEDAGTSEAADPASRR